MQLAKMVYESTEGFPKPEQFGLALQLRRAAVSVASTIAEGAARSSRREFAQFLSVSLGSLAELDTQLELAASLGWLRNTETLGTQHERVGKLTTKLRQAIARAPGNEQRATNSGQRK